tara:strand:+ start:10723 stop:11004 length:282 start_codon:yes stop_codon:yes gene_type:complete
MTKKYRPSNGSEGEAFISKWCANCRNEDFDLDSDDHCHILGATMMYSIDEDGYPREWIYGDHGPRCTAFDDIAMPVGVYRCDKTIDMFEGDRK